MGQVYPDEIQFPKAKTILQSEWVDFKPGVVIGTKAKVKKEPKQRLGL